MPLARGTTLGPYEIVMLIGSGGMGEVYRARDPRLERDVAIKVVRHQLDAEMLARFEREARTVAALSHPNTLQIFDVGRQGGVPYLVTELLTGHTLRARLGDGPLPVADVLSIARQIGEALGAAHELGIVHRDLKPENVFVLPTGVVKLMDFGLASHRPPVPADDMETMLSSTPGMVLGTVGYMAPEQVRGYDCDARADIFALGVTLYEMVAGERPFGGATRADVIGAVLTAQAPPFTSARVVPAGLDRIVERALSKDPSGRYQSARELVAALDMLSAGPAQQPAPSDPGAREPSLAVLPFADLSPHRDHEYFCEGMAEEILGGLARVPGLRVAAASASQRFRGRDHDLKDVGRALNVEHVLEGSVRAAGQRLRVAVRLTTVESGHVAWSEQFDRTLSDVFEVQEEIARTVVLAMQGRMGTASVDSRLVRPPTPNIDAYGRYLEGRFQWNRRTEPALVESLRCFQQASNIDPGFARAVAGLADAHTAMGIYGLRAPEDAMPYAKAAASAALQLDANLPDALASLGTVLALYDWSWTESELAFRRALALDPTYATGLQWYAAHGLAPRGRFDEAVSLLERALASDSAALPIVVSLGFVHYLQGRFDQAHAVLHRALRHDPGFIPAHFFLAHVCSEMGDHERALSHAGHAVGFSGWSPETIGALGYVAARAGRENEARDALARLEAASLTRYVSPGFAAQVHAALGDATSAIGQLTTAVDRRAADVAWMAVRPTFRMLRDRPAFTALADRLHLTGALPHAGTGTA